MGCNGVVGGFVVVVVVTKTFTNFFVVVHRFSLVFCMLSCLCCCFYCGFVVIQTTLSALYLYHFIIFVCFFFTIKINLIHSTFFSFKIYRFFVCFYHFFEFSFVFYFLLFQFIFYFFILIYFYFLLF